MIRERKQRPSVVILGGGFAGLACANALDAEDFAVTLVDRKAHFEFLPNIHELVSGVKKAQALRLPLKSTLEAGGHRFIRAEVDALDPSAKTVNVGRRTLHADYLVIAIGSADADFGVSGVREYALGFKSVAQCAAIHRHLNGVMRRQSHPRVTIIGAGLEGIEGLGEVLRRYREKRPRLALVEARAALLPGAPAAVSRHLADLCADWDVEVLTGDPVARITAKTVLLKSGRRLRSDATIWTGGPAPPPLLAASGLASPESWVRVDQRLEHRKFKDVFIAGDDAQLPRPVSRQAYHALDMGRCVAANIARRSRGKRPLAFKPSGKPTLLSFGDIDAVLIGDKVNLAGPALAVGKEAVFEAVMAQLDQRPASTRLEDVLERGKAAGRELLWPTLRSWQTLRRQLQLKRLG